MSNKNLKILFVVLFILSLCFPGISYTEESSQVTNVLYGYEILLYGWGGLAVGMFAWYGNILIIFSLLWLRSKRYRDSAGAAATGFIIGLQAFWLKELPGNMGDQGGDVINYLGVSYYIWMSSICVLALYAYRLYKEESKVQ